LSSRPEYIYVNLKDIEGKKHWNKVMLVHELQSRTDNLKFLKAMLTGDVDEVEKF